MLFRSLSEARASRVVRFTVKRISPIVLWVSFWGLQLSGSQAWRLPGIGALLSLSTLLPAWGYARLAGLDRPQTGSLLTCAMFSNVGYLGAFLVFALYGEQGYGLAVLYLLSFNPCFYLIGFTVAKRFGHRLDTAASSSWYSDELRFYPFVGLAIGLILNLAKVPRPAGLALLNRFLIPIDTILYLAAIGSQLRVEPLSAGSRGACLAVSAIKFWYTPLVGWLLLSIIPLDGVPRFVVLLEASMPVAISPLMLSLLFGLDRRLSNALWLFTTLLAIPWLLVYLPLIHR